MLGKRNVNCLSCGTEPTSNNVIQGKDGRYYKADQSLGIGTSLKDMTFYKDDVFNCSKGMSTVGSRI